MTQTLGQKLSPILQEIEEALWCKEANMPNVPHDFDDNAFRASCKIFMAAMLDYSHKEMMRKNYTQKEMEDRAEALGVRLRHLVFEFTGINTLEFYDAK